MTVNRNKHFHFLAQYIWLWKLSFQIMWGNASKLIPLPIPPMLCRHSSCASHANFKVKHKSVTLLLCLERWPNSTRNFSEGKGKVKWLRNAEVLAKSYRRNSAKAECWMTGKILQGFRQALSLSVVTDEKTATRLWCRDM